MDPDKAMRFVEEHQADKVTAGGYTFDKYAKLTVAPDPKNLNNAIIQGERNGPNGEVIPFEIQ